MVVGMVGVFIASLSVHFILRWAWRVRIVEELEKAAGIEPDLNMPFDDRLQVISMLFTKLAIIYSAGIQTIIALDKSDLDDLVGGMGSGDNDDDVDPTEWN
jgi:hypothetical protein